MLAAGDRIPSINLKRMAESGIDTINIAEHIEGKYCVILGVPGAFTPICHVQHVPSFVKYADHFFKNGIDEIICISVTDPFVMSTWAKTVDPEHKITMLADGNAEFVRSTGMGFDGSDMGLGLRSNRYVAIVDNGVISSIDIEEKPSICSVSNALSILKKIKGEQEDASPFSHFTGQTSS